MGRNSKWIWVVLLFGVVVVGSLIQYSKVPGEEGSPKIQIKPRSYDFGDIPRKIVKTTFIVENTGESALDIESVSTSCGCTSAKISSERISPGKTAELIVEMDPNVMGNITGKVERTIYVQSNDPIRPEVEVFITADIQG